MTELRRFLQNPRNELFEKHSRSTIAKYYSSEKDLNYYSSFSDENSSSEEFEDEYSNFQAKFSHSNGFLRRNNTISDFRNQIEIEDDCGENWNTSPEHRDEADIIESYSQDEYRHYDEFKDYEDDSQSFDGHVHYSSV